MLARIDAVLTAERVRNYSVIFVVLGAVSLATTWLGGPFWSDHPGPPFLPDYLAHWTGGRLLLMGRTHDLYDIPTQGQLQRSVFPGSTGLSWFVSPPADALLYVPLAALPYVASGTVWLVLSIALLAVCLRLTRPLLDRRQRAFGLFVLVVLALPATLEVLGSGQDSLLFLLLWVAGLRMMQRGSDARAGALLGMVALKPQLAVLIPVMLLAQRRFRALATFTLVAGSVVGLSVLLVGTDGAVTWARTLTSRTYTEQVQHGQAWKMQSLPAFADAWTLSPVLPALFLALGAIVVFLATRRLRNDVTASFAVTSLTTVVSSPHLLVYDCVLLIPALAFAVGRLNRPSVRVVAVVVFVLQWTAPVRHVLAITLADSPLLDAPWVAPAIAALLVVSLRAIAWDQESIAGGARERAEIWRRQERPCRDE